MHISEGVLSAPVLLAGAALAAGGVWRGLKAIDQGGVPKAAVLAAAFFVASLIHVSVGPASTHLVLGGLVGLLLGWAAFPVILAGLLLQGLLFQFGGLTVLGVNDFNIAAPAVLLSLALRRPISGANKTVAMAAAALLGGGSILLSSALVALCLRLSGQAFAVAAPAVVVANLPVVAVEAVMTALVAGFLAKVRPSLLGGPVTQ